MDPYRGMEVREKEPVSVCAAPKMIHMSSGTIVRSVPCEVPGWWARLINGIKNDDIWICDGCGCKWKYMYGKWYQLG